MSAEKPVEPSSDRREQDGISGPLGADFIIPALGVALIAYYSATTVSLTWEARATGLVIAAVLGPLSVLHMVRMVLAVSRRKATFGFGDLVDNTPFNRQRLGLIVLVTIFVAAIPWIGTATGLFFLLTACMLLMGVRKVRTLLAVALTTTAVVYLLLIYLLNSRLPQGPVEKLLGSLLGR